MKVRTVWITLSISVVAYRTDIPISRQHLLGFEIVAKRTAVDAINSFIHKTPSQNDEFMTINDFLVNVLGTKCFFQCIRAPQSSNIGENNLGWRWPPHNFALVEKGIHFASQSTGFIILFAGNKGLDIIDRFNCRFSAGVLIIEEN